MKADETTSEHDEVSLLLPWLVNDTLDPGQRDRVTDHLKVCSSCRREARDLRSLSVAVDTDARARHDERADVDADLIRVMQRIDRGADGGRSPDGGNSPLRRLLDAIAPVISPGPVRQWGIPALAVLLVLAVGSPLWLDRHDDDYAVLSSTDRSEEGLRFSVQFTQPTEPVDARRIFREYADAPDAELALTRLDDRNYTVGFSGTVDADVLMEALRGLQGHAGIDRVDVVP